MSENALKQSISASPIVWPRLGLRRLTFVVLLVALLVVFLLSLAMGSVSIPLDEIVTILLGGEAGRASWEIIIMNVRLPKAITATLAGAALAVAGLQMQTLFRNPLAGPYVLGISSGASLGVALVILSTTTVTTGAFLEGLGFLGDLSVIVAASLGSTLVLGLVVFVARRVNTMTLLIIGLLFGYATGAVVNLLLYFADNERIRAYINWTFGSFGDVTWSQLAVLAPAILAALLLSYMLAKPLNALLLGEAYARSMGLNVKRARVWIISSAAVLAGGITAFCGPIAFLGIAVPHLCRSLFNTSNHRILMPAVMLMGALLALFADIVAQMPNSQTILPLNTVMALTGAPVVAWVILRRRNLRKSFAA